jgi:hypothetical protein
MDAQNVKDFTDLLIAVRKTMDEYLYSGELKGVACAAGTLTSRINNLKVIVGACADREPNDKDRFEMSSLATTLTWLSEDDYCAKDFKGIKLVLPDTAFNAAHPDIAIPGEIDFPAAMVMLHSAAIEIVLEGKPASLSGK